jgi:hypothetical protein
MMGIQLVRDVELIRHAYVLPASQRRGIGGALLRHLRQLRTRRILIGTWEAADWAIRFYTRHGFELVAPSHKTALLKDLLARPGSTDGGFGGTGKSSSRGNVTPCAHLRRVPFLAECRNRV